jgi:hypothetical protein
MGLDIDTVANNQLIRSITTGENSLMTRTKIGSFALDDFATVIAKIETIIKTRVKHGRVIKKIQTDTIF